MIFFISVFAVILIISLIGYFFGFTALILVFCLLFLALAFLLYTAPEGYEDDDGFHLKK